MTSNNNDDPLYGFVVDKFIANRIQSSYVRSQQINSQTMAFRSLRLRGDMRDIEPNTPNYDFTQYDTDYSDPWKPMWSAQNKGYSLDARQQGALISNGKISMFSSFDVMDVQKMYILTNNQKLHGSYAANAIEPFYVTGLKFFHTDADQLSIFTQQQELNLKTATLHTRFKVVDKASGHDVRADVDLYAPRHIPSAVCQKVWVYRPKKAYFPSGGDTAKVPLFHQVYNKSNLRDVTYNNNIFHHQSASSQSVYVLSGRGTTESGRIVAFATVYVLSDPARVENMGFNTQDQPHLTCVNTLRILFHASDPVDKKISIDIFSVIMTDADFVNPLDEAKKLALTVYLGPTSPPASLSKVRTNHLQAWSRLWETQMTIHPKNNITSAEGERIDTLNRLIRMAMYNLYSAARDRGVLSSDVYPILDMHGELFYEGDLWIMPLLLFLKPAAAKSVLEHRYKSLDLAKSVATSYGYNGAKFPDASTSGLKNTMLWCAETPSRIFNNALILINTWNHYRITHDRDFLINKGFPVMRGIAEFLTDLTEYDDAEERYVLKHVIGLNQSESQKNNAFVNNLVKLALRFFIESSYELGYYVPEAWMTIYHTLPVHFYEKDEIGKKVIKADAYSIPEDKYDILETLFVLLPSYSKLFFCHEDFMGQTFDYDAIKQNIDFYEKRRRSATEHHPYNIAVLGILYGIYAQHDETYIDQFQHYLDLFLDTYVKGIWHHMLDFNVYRPSLSLESNAIFLMIILQSMVGMRVIGGVSETTFYYEEMQIKTAESRNMPKYWANVIVQAFGDHQRKTALTRNRILYLEKNA